MEDIDNVMEKLTQKSSRKGKTPDIAPRCLRDREKLKKRKLEAQEKDPSQWVTEDESKRKKGRGRKSHRHGKSHSKKAEPEPEPEPELEDDVDDKPLIVVSESETPEFEEESIKLSVIQEAPTPSADPTEEIKSPTTEFPEKLTLQMEDLPEGNMPLEEKHPAYL